jgi:MFS family permease
MRSEKGRWRIAWLLGIGVLVNYFDRVNIAVAHDALRQEFGITTFTFGLLLSSFNWTYALLQLPGGVLLDRFGVRTVGCVSAFLWSAASFAGALAANTGSFFGARLLLGVGEAPTFPANAKAIGRWFPPAERSLPTSIFDAAAKFGPAIGVPAIGFLLLRFGWRISFAATGVLSFFYFLAFSFIYRDPSRYAIQVSHRTAGASLSYLLRQRKIIGLVTGFFGYNYCFYLLLLWLPTYFSALKLSPSTSLIYSAIPWLAATATDLLIGGWFVDALIRRGRDDSLVRKTVLISGTTLGLGVAAPLFTNNPAAALVWLTVALAGLAAAAPVGWSIPSLIAPHGSVGKVGAILNTGNQLAGIVAPIVTAALADPSNALGPAFAVAAVVLVTGIAAYIFLLGRIEPVQEPIPA